MSAPELLSEHGCFGGLQRFYKHESQVIGLPQNEKARREKKIAAFHKDHALFVCFAPANNPEIVVAVIAENAGSGGAVAAPIARLILAAHFDRKKKAQMGWQAPELLATDENLHRQ